MNRCQKTQELLADYRTGILSSSKNAWIEEHIKQCQDCAEELHLLDGVLALVDANTPEYEAPAGLWNGVYNRITSPEHAQSGLLDAFRHRVTSPIRAAGVGVAVVALAAGIMLSMATHSPGKPVQVASNIEYIQGHALYAGHAPLADRVSYLSVVAASESNK